MGVFSDLKNIQQKKWSPLTFVINAVLLLIILGIVVWLGQWFWDKISLVINVFVWTWNTSKILFAVAALLSVAISYLLGKYHLTQFWFGKQDSGLTAIKMPEGDVMKYVDGVVFPEYQRGGKILVDGVMIIGGATPVSEVPKEKIIKTNKTATEVFGSYFIPILYWLLGAKK